MHIFQHKTPRRILVLSTLLLGAFGLFACLPTKVEPRSSPGFEPAIDGAWQMPVQAATRTALEARFADARDAEGIHALTVALATAQSGQWNATAPQTAEVFWWASVGKLVTTILVLQEVEAGRLTLDADITSYLPNTDDLPDGVTVRHLLTHTSGVPDFDSLGLLEERFGLFDRSVLLREALARDVDFDAGEDWAYSNTGFLLLQRIIESVRGIPYHELVQAQISRPLGLSGFEALDGASPAHLTLPALGDPRPSSEYPSNIGGAGNIIATASEMVTFWQAAMAGQLVDPVLLRQALASLYPVFESEAMEMGAGIMVFPTSDNSGHWLGHSGGAEQVGAALLYSPRRQMVIAVAGTGPEIHALEIANLLIEAMDRCEADQC